MKRPNLFLAVAIALTTLIPMLAPSAMAGSACPPGSIWRAAREFRQQTSQNQIPTETKSEEVLSNFEIKVKQISEAIAEKKFDLAIINIDSMVSDGYWPPIDSVNARLKDLKSPYRFVMTEPKPGEVNPRVSRYRGPHGGGELRIFDLAIREGKTNIRYWDSRKFFPSDEGTAFEKYSKDTFPF